MRELFRAECEFEVGAVLKVLNYKDNAYADKKERLQIWVDAVDSNSIVLSLEDEIRLSKMLNDRDAFQILASVQGDGSRMETKLTNESIARFLNGLDTYPSKKNKLSKEFIEKLKENGFVVAVPSYYNDGVIEFIGAISNSCIYTHASERGVLEGKWDNLVYVNRTGLVYEVDQEKEVSPYAVETIEGVLRLAAAYKASMQLWAVPIETKGRYCGVSFKTEIRHALFDVQEVGKSMGHSLVFNINDLPQYKEGDI